MDRILANLNPKQHEAVTATPQNTLILAGAGSGKTRVIVHRIAYLFQQYQCSPYDILAVTFTNKAAHELKHRIEALCQIDTRAMWVGTFHGLCNRLLRIHSEAAKLPQNFQVLDQDDQYRLIRRVLKQLNLDEKAWPPKQAQHFINQQKEQGRYPEHVQVEQRHYADQTWLRVYEVYQSICEQSGLVDFAELLLRAYHLLKQHAEIRVHYQERFKHIFVDEFQDTNAIQYKWLKMLSLDSRLRGNDTGRTQGSAPTRPQNTMTVVGDDDQSIYGWRGAKIENIHHFQKDFAPVNIIRLEQNYRSTANILNAANAVITNNSDRLGKELWTEGEAGAQIQVYAAFNEMDEARFIVAQIKTLLHNGFQHRDIALLYRSNAQSRVLEEALMQSGLPYRVYGGHRFFDRAEIKDALAYLRLMENQHDDAAFERIINVPTRGIGAKCQQTLREIARSQSCSLFNAAQAAVSQNLITARALSSVQNFIALIDTIKTTTENLPLERIIETMLDLTGLVTFYQNEPGERAQGRVDNLGELVTAAKQFRPDITEPEQLEWSSLALFLAHAVLESGEEQSEQYQDSIQLMTLHAAKGLEFKAVFICGMEEQLFPSQQSHMDHQRLSEERRLCYVGMTRAMEILTLTHAESRRVYGKIQYQSPSRFLTEIPGEYTHELRPKSNISRPVSYQQRRDDFDGFDQTPRYQRYPNANMQRSRSNYSNTEGRRPSKGQGLTINGQTYRIGQRVNHPSFGEGVVLNIAGQGEQGRLQIQFSQVGTKWIMPSYVALDSRRPPND